MSGVSTFIDRILSEMAQPTDGTGYWTRADVLSKLSFIQREISREAKNIPATSNSITVSASASEITIESSGNMLDILNAYRVYGGNTREIIGYTQEELLNYDPGWRTRTGSIIRGFLRDTAADGKLRVYPIPDNGNNAVIVDYIKLATAVTGETGDIEIPAADQYCLECGVKAHLYLLDRDGSNKDVAATWKALHDAELEKVKERSRAKRTPTFDVIQERVELNTGVIPRIYYPWEV